MWPAGYLTLEASHGPVLWTGHFHDAQHDSQERTMYRYVPAEAVYARPICAVLHDAPATWRDAFEVDGAAGVAGVLQTLCRVLDGECIPTGFDSAYQLALARLWLDILRVVPPAAERRLSPPQVVTWDGAQTDHGNAGGTDG